MGIELIRSILIPPSIQGVSATTDDSFRSLLRRLTRSSSISFLGYSQYNAAKKTSLETSGSTVDMLSVAEAEALRGGSDYVKFHTAHEVSAIVCLERLHNTK